MIPGYLQLIATENQALNVTHTLSNPGKIPCFGYSISATRCKVGSTLVNVKDSVCHGCYALAGWYATRKVIHEAMEKRYQALFNPRWVEAMIFHIQNKKQTYFRWHDSGDLQGLWHLDMIAQVAMMCPDTLFWLPTREYGIVKEYWELNGRVPLNKLLPNLIIRMSAHMLEQEPPASFLERVGVTGSSVVKENFTCPASTKSYISQNGKHEKLYGYCGACRSCWDQKVLVVSYKSHIAKRGRKKQI